MDAILARLADRRLFPNLKQVVVAGHSGGGQVVQRYAIAGRGEEQLTRENIGVRYVVANPSSYAYFSAERPEPAVASSCPGYNDWKYGMESRPPYLAAPAAGELEQRYVARQVIYLLGTLDTDPDQSALDKSCMAEAQGPYRYARGHAYVAAMQRRDGGTPNHRVWDVPGVGHNGDKMLTSPLRNAGPVRCAGLRGKPVTEQAAPLKPSWPPSSRAAPRPRRASRISGSCR